MEIVVKRFDELSLKELYAILQLRSEVFVVEQECIYQDIDGKDSLAFHVLGKHQDKIVAYVRIFDKGDYFEHVAIGRVVVRESFRKSGYGRLIMKGSLDFIKAKLNASLVALSAQTYLKRFYNDLGFKEVGEEYLEDGIPHIKMVGNFHS